MQGLAGAFHLHALADIGRKACPVCFGAQYLVSSGLCEDERVSFSVEEGRFIDKEKKEELH